MQELAFSKNSDEVTYHFMHHNLRMMEGVPGKHPIFAQSSHLH
jgi:hypothetical protein